MTAKKRIYKHDLKEDHFVTATFQFTSYVREHQNLFISILAVIVIVAIVIAVAMSSRGRSKEDAGRMLGEATILYQQGNFDGAIERCQALIDQHGGSKHAANGVVYLADSHLKLQHYEDAINAFQLYLDKYDDDDFLVASSLTGIATCHEQLDQFSQAGDFYLKAAEDVPGFYGAPEAIMNSGRCYATAGEIEKARASYQKLIADYGESRYMNLAKMALSELQ
ncbi:tol-pal system YbgF family protein [Candidatus Zixiibacteriota bacterium]